MLNESESTFSFSPRPEAHAMNWEELLPPVKRAVRDLLLRIEGATQKELKKGGVAANCFLVFGDRGTGKTTVLLSAKHACNPETNFFGKENRENQDDVNLRSDAKNRADNLKNVVWLDVLDLEPLPPGANLLTTMLTRVRNALYSADFEKRSLEHASILEESTDTGLQKLNQLIKDATLMWEDIHEQDTRSRANRQVAAADTYAQFQTQFQSAIDTLSKELSRRRGSGEKYRPIVLPIDNIDRSTEHLNSIVKLAQMVFCPRLWLVMAGDREDVDTFLERAYWKELIRIGEGAGATGKTGVSGEDEALVMARRQAAAALHRLLPPSHRIEVDLMKPEETLAFTPSFTVESMLPDYGKDIRTLLEQVSVTGDQQIKLVELFDMTERIKNVGNETGKFSCLTEAAELGLRLPARQALDLWQLAYWITTDSRIEKNREAETIAVTMLLNVIAESSMSSEMSRLLQKKIIRRNSQGRTMLDFWDPDSPPPSLLNVFRLTSADFELQPSAEKVRLEVNHYKPLMLRLWLSQKEKEGNGNPNMSDSLPDLVSAWLTVLYDAVVLSSEDGVANRPLMVPCTGITCWHWVPETEQQWSVQPWPVPVWGNFLAYDLFGQLWHSFLSTLRKNNYKLLNQNGCEDSSLRMLAAGYVACALGTYSAFLPTGKGEATKSVLASLKESIHSAFENNDRGTTEEAIKHAEMKVIRAAAHVYEEILKDRGSIYQFDEATRPMRDWLEKGLPLLLSRLYVPVAVGAKPRAKEIIEDLESHMGSKLTQYWKNNSDAIFAYAKKPVPVDVNLYSSEEDYSKAAEKAQNHFKKLHDDDMVWFPSK